MASFTLVEVHFEEGSLSVSLPFGYGSSDDEPAAVADGGTGSKGAAVIGVFLFFVIAAAVVKYLSGDEEDVAIRTAEGEAVDIEA